MQCPHCAVEIPAGVAFCPSCGKAASVSSGGPKLIREGGLATSYTGQSLQVEELTKMMKRSFVALLVVAILQTLAALVFGAVAFAGGSLPGTANKPGTPPAPGAAMITAVVCALIAAIFYGLAVWARKQPFPAALTGLILIVSLWLIDAVIDPLTIVSGIIVKIFIALILIRAVKAGLTHRRLVRQMSAEQLAQV